MSGAGTRFIKAGYETIKPLIKVHGLPVIEYVVDLFPGEKDFLFVCREDHLKSTSLYQVLKKIAPEGHIKAIPGHKKGPVFTVSKVFDLIADNEPVIVNYCDFFMDWDYDDFKRAIQLTGCDGAVPSYRGFHPHLLHKNNVYASSRTDSNGFMMEIREKFSFDTDKTKVPHSAGMYYFRSGKLIKQYFRQLMKTGPQIHGEYYVSQVYNPMYRDGLKILVYDKIRHFCQWGTPADLEEYQYWSAIFERWK